MGAIDLIIIMEKKLYSTPQTCVFKLDERKSLLSESDPSGNMSGGSDEAKAGYFDFEDTPW